MPCFFSAAAAAAPRPAATPRPAAATTPPRGRHQLFLPLHLLLLLFLGVLPGPPARVAVFVAAYIDHTQFVTSTDVRIRDLATHRANRYVIDYNETHPRYSYASQAFEGGLRTDANFAADFEGPRPGSYGWTPDASRVDRGRIRGAHYNTFDYPLTHPTRPLDSSGDNSSTTVTVSATDWPRKLAPPRSVHFYTGTFDDPHPVVTVDGDFFGRGTWRNSTSGLQMPSPVSSIVPLPRHRSPFRR